MLTTFFWAISILLKQLYNWYLRSSNINIVKSNLQKWSTPILHAAALRLELRNGLQRIHINFVFLSKYKQEFPH